MDVLTLFGLISVSSMMFFYALEKRSHWFVLAFATSCASWHQFMDFFRKHGHLVLSNWSGLA